MAAAVTRELEVEYGDFRFGGDTDNLIHSFNRGEKNYESETWTFEVLVTGTTEANFFSATEDIERAFRIPRQRLIIRQGSETLRDLNPLQNSGYNSLPRIVKVGGEFDTGRSRMYTVSVDFELPADLQGQDGRRESTTTITFDAGVGDPLTYSEGDGSIISLNTAPSDHLHLGDNSGDGSPDLRNHSGCCSTPYRITSPTFSFFRMCSVDVVGGSGSGTSTSNSVPTVVSNEARNLTPTNGATTFNLDHDSVADGISSGGRITVALDIA